MLNPGLMRHRLTIERAVETRNSVGEVVETWTTFQQVRARVVPRGGKETKDGRLIYAPGSAAIYLRYRPGVTSKMRVRWGDRYYRIENIRNHDENRRDLVIEAVEIFEEATS